MTGTVAVQRLQRVLSWFLTVQLAKTQAVVRSVIVWLLQLHSMSVRAQGELAISFNRQVRYEAAVSMMFRVEGASINCILHIRA